MEVEIGESSSQRVGKDEKCYDECISAKIKRNLVKAVMLLAGNKDVEQMDCSSLLKEEWCRHIFIISFESISLTGLNECGKDKDILPIPLRTLNESLLGADMASSYLSSHTLRTVLTFV